MTAKKISDSEVGARTIASLPTRPTAPAAFGGRGYTAAQMKAAFDALPLLLTERFNRLLEDIEATGTDSLANAIPTTLGEGHTLYDLFSDIESGALATYMVAKDAPLIHVLESLESRIAALEEKHP